MSLLFSDIINQKPNIDGNPLRIRGAWSKSQMLPVMVRGLAVKSKHKTGYKRLTRFFLRILWSGRVEELGPHPWKNTKLSQLNNRNLQRAINHIKSPPKPLMSGALPVQG